VGEGAEDDAQSFDAFFRRASKPLVVQAYMLTGDQVVAQDLAQEALLRAWTRWPRVRKLDDSLAWTRRVLHNLAVSRSRYDRVRQRQVDPPVALPPPNLAHLEIAKVLRSLPRDQAIALVLHDGAGASVREIASQLDAPEGTVKSWLSRGRAAAAAGLEASSPSMKEGHACR
jgi:RNA polymerase sigma-70 factor (ECF subfamily)